MVLELVIFVCLVTLAFLYYKDRDFFLKELSIKDEELLRLIRENQKSNKKEKRYFDLKKDADYKGEYPVRSTSGSAGYDLHASYDECIPPNETRLIKTGVTAKMNEDDVLLICSRSGLALKHSVFVLNACGIVDSDYYPNEIGVILHNAGKSDFVINKGDRIAQGVFTKFLKVDNDIHNYKLVNVERTSGFGSTGK